MKSYTEIVDGQSSPPTRTIRFTFSHKIHLVDDSTIEVVIHPTDKVVRFDKSYWDYLVTQHGEVGAEKFLEDAELYLLREEVLKGMR